ncbi:MAG: hypothetical protein DRJ03_25890 [Chloroflexi bacterium]|nr:MAG: hypothetical protein DRI81_15175 [Chloroflexota bacterium]RLC78006.1 MAG: hypothetical protein DRJ03_25890 [Chloroflexota bacterium]
MKQGNLAWITLVIVFVILATLACGLESDKSTPSVTISAPPSGTTVTAGEEVQITSMAVAEAGIARVELAVNGQVMRRDEPPSGNPTSFSVVQPWVPAAEGEVTVSVIVYDTEGAASETAAITLQVAAAVAEATPTPDVTPTPVEDVEGPSGCTLNASYVADVTIPDNTKVAPGATFVKTWRIRNSGTCDWEAGFNMVFAGEEQMGGPASVEAPATAAGSTADVSVNLTAPDEPGAHRGNWRMQSNDGLAFGSTVYVKIVVQEPTAEPTVEPTEEATEEATEEPTEESTEESTAPPTDLQVTFQADGSALFTWNDAVGEKKYDYEISFVAGMVGAASAGDLPADTTSYDGGTMGCGGHGDFTIIAIAENDSEIGRLSIGFDTDPCPEETVTLDPASRGQVESGGGIYSPNNAGDTSSDEGLQGFITFDVTSIPDSATILSAKLEVVSFDTLGDPFGNLGCLRAYVDNYGILDASDYTPPPVTGAIVRFCSEGELNDSSVQELNSTGVSGIQDALADDQFQIRLQFKDDETDGNGVADVARITFRLEVTYQP